ncbi:MAG: nitroreductase family protein [Bacteroidota bacterium]
MAIPTSRTKEKATITIDSTRCTGCALCVEVCKDFSIKIIDGKASESDTPAFGCIACGHCMAICPSGAIQITGRFLSPDDLFNIPDVSKTSDYTSLLNLYYRRRSIREFKEKEVEKELIDKVIEAAKSAPMGLPPSDVHVLVLDSKEKVLTFSKDYCDHLESIKWLTSNWFLAIMRPFWGKSNDEMFRKFLKPCIELFTSHMKKGENYVTYDAPVALYFYGSPYTDPADPIIAATYAMIAAESLGLGSCMLGAIHLFIQNGRSAIKFRKKYRIRFKSKEGLVLILGYPKIKYKKSIKRSFASVDYL